MARIQILELPTKVLGEAVETPFAFIIDESTTADLQGLEAGDLAGFVESAGASAVLVSKGTLDIPANDLPETAPIVNTSN